MSSATQPSFEFGRIGHNRGVYVLAVVLLMASLAPLVLAGGFIFGASVVRLAGSGTAGIASRTAMLASRIHEEETLLADVKNLPPEDDDNWLDVGLAQEQAKRIALRLPSQREALAESRAELAASSAADRSLFLKMLPVGAAALAAILGLLYWGTCSKLTIRLLAHIGALPAGAAEAGATRLVEDLCGRLHLPPPKLYIIQSGVPYTLSAAMDKHHAMLAVTRGALDLLDQRELEAMLAHELSHIGNHDIELNTLLASAALFIRLPLSGLRRRWSRGYIAASLEQEAARTDRYFYRYGWQFGIRRIIFMGMMGLLLLPMLIYIFLVAPIAGHLIRAFVSHDLEFMADADAAALTGNPEGLVSALAKVGGATSKLVDSNPAFQHSCVAGASASGGWLSRSFQPTHPSPAKRIQRLVEVFGAARFSGLKGAIDAGKQYAGQHETTGEEHLIQVAADDLAAVRQGNAMGKVYRLLSTEEVPVHESQRPSSLVVAWMKPGALLVVFEDMGKMLAVNTAQEHYGYIDRKTKLKPVPGVLPQEVYDPTARAAVEETLARREAAAAKASAPDAPAASAPGPLGLTREQWWMVVGFAVMLFAGITILLIVAAGK